MEVECQQLSWDQIYDLCLKLSSAIKKSGFKPDALVAIGRGGWIPGRLISDFLGIRELYSIKAEYWDVAETRDQAVITQPINVDVNGKKLLVIDDVADTGKTLNVVVSHLRKVGAAEVRTAVLQYKKTSEFSPDYAAQILKRWVWVVYPWGLIETTVGFIQKLGKRDSGLVGSNELIAEELKKRFNLSVSPEIVELAKSLLSSG
ncbi:MAG: phosphoribosyltransferase [Archaeoglobus sp.]|nr:phosphoribosyltransferase [Archaeoglobus sp.]